MWNHRSFPSRSRAPSVKSMEGVEYEDDIKAEFPEGQPIPLHTGWQNSSGNIDTGGFQRGHRSRFSETHMSIDSNGYQEEVKRSWEADPSHQWDSTHAAITDHIQYVVRADYQDGSTVPEYYLYPGYTDPRPESPNDTEMRDATPDIDFEPATTSLAGLSLAPTPAHLNLADQPTPTQAHFALADLQTPTQAHFSQADLATPTQAHFSQADLATPTQDTFPSAPIMQAIPESTPLAASTTPPPQILPGVSTSPRQSPSHPTTPPPVPKSPTPSPPPPETFSLPQSPLSPSANAVSPPPQATPPRQTPTQAASEASPSPVSHPQHPPRETTPPPPTPVQEASPLQVPQTPVASVEPKLHQATSPPSASQPSTPPHQVVSQQDASPPRIPHSVTPPPRVGTSSPQGSPTTSPPRPVTRPPRETVREVLIPKSRRDKSTISENKVTVKFVFPWSEIDDGVEDQEKDDEPGPSARPRRQNSAKGKRRASESPSRSPPPPLPQPTAGQPSEPVSKPSAAGQTRAAPTDDELSGSRPQRQKQTGEATLAGDPEPSGSNLDRYLGRYKGHCEEGIHVYKPLGLSEAYAGRRMRGFFKTFKCGDCQRGWRDKLKARAEIEKTEKEQWEREKAEREKAEKEQAENDKGKGREVPEMPERVVIPNVISVYFCLTCEKHICNFCCIAKYGRLPRMRD